MYPSLVEVDRIGIGLFPSSVEVIEFVCWLRALSLFGRGDCDCVGYGPYPFSVEVDCSCIASVAL